MCCDETAEVVIARSAKRDEAISATQRDEAISVTRLCFGYSALRINLHAGGSADIRIGFGLTVGFGSSSRLVNHQSRSLPQPSSVGGMCCPLHSVLSFGQLMRIWK